MTFSKTKLALAELSNSLDTSAAALEAASRQLSEKQALTLASSSRQNARPTADLAAK